MSEQEQRELERKAKGWDRIAVLLGASDDWDGGADFLEAIAEEINATRPDGTKPIGDTTKEEWREYGRARGMKRDDDWRQDEDDEDEEEADPWSVDPITPARGGHR